MQYPGIFAIAAALAAPGAASAQPADVQAQAEAMVQAAFPADGPGAAILVSRRGQILYAGGRGLADVEARRPITPDTMFRLGSIAKQFTAAVVLQLAAEGRLSLDDPISRFFPDFPQPSARATVRQLLNHSSGIQDYSKIPGWIDRTAGRPMTTAELVAEVRSRPATAAPGAAWEYNNAGYMMLGAIVEQVTGRPWYEAVEQRITRPLGLANIRPGITGEADPLTASGYTEDDGRPRPTRGAHMSVAHAAGGLVGSARDLARWADALHNGRVLNPAMYREMTSPARLADGSTRPYGMGLRLQRLRGRPMFVHGGAGRGLDTDTVYLPSEGLYVAILSNSDEPAADPSILTRRLAALAMGDPFPSFARAEVPLSAIKPLFGAYRSASGTEMRFFPRDGRLYLAGGEQEMEAFPAGNDRFFFGPGRLVWVGFERRPDGAHVMEVHEAADAQPERSVRTGDAPPPLAVAPALLRTYAGTFQTETVAVTIALAENGGLTIQPTGGQPMPLRPVSDTEFIADRAGFRIVFHVEDGRVGRLTLHRGARRLEGRRVER
jgi:CubicO group peptidase (beta-lactamase class C family)